MAQNGDAPGAAGVMSPEPGDGHAEVLSKARQEGKGVRVAIAVVTGVAQQDIEPPGAEARPGATSVPLSFWSGRS